MSLAQPRWTLERHVPLALIAAILLQTALALVWAGQMVQRIQYIEARTDFIDRTGERIARLEENVIFMRASLERLEQKLDSFHAKK